MKIPENFKNLDKEALWEIFLEGINGFTDDFMANGRDPEIPSEREPF